MEGHSQSLPVITMRVCQSSIRIEAFPVILGGKSKHYQDICLILGQNHKNIRFQASIFNLYRDAESFRIQAQPN